MVASFVSDLLMPPIGLLLGKMDFTNLFITLTGIRHATLTETQAAGAVTLNYGLFLTTVINFLIVGFAIFLMIRQVNKIRKPAAALSVSRTRRVPPIRRGRRRSAYSSSAGHAR